MILLAISPLIGYLVAIMFLGQKIYLYYIGYPIVFLSSFLTILALTVVARYLKIEIVGDFFLVQTKKKIEIFKNEDKTPFYV